MSFERLMIVLAAGGLLSLAPISTLGTGAAASAQDHGEHSGGVHGGRGSSHDEHSGGRGGGTGGRRGSGSGHASSSGGHHVPTGVGDDPSTSDGHDDEHGDDHADDSSHASQGKKGGGGQAAAGSGRGQAAAGSGGGRGAGAGRRSSDDPKGRSDDRGGRDSQHSGGRPVWAQEGLPDVELGRLNVARAPARVLDRALSEVVSEWSDEKNAWYGLPLDEAMARLAELEKGIRVESPLGNLGMYRSLLSGGSPVPVQGDRLRLAALFLGGASDKTIPIVPDTVIALNTILGVGDDLSGAQVAALAGDADRVRAAILSAHGDSGEAESGHDH